MKKPTPNTDQEWYVRSHGHIRVINAPSKLEAAGIFAEDLTADELGFLILVRDTPFPETDILQPDTTCYLASTVSVHRGLLDQSAADTFDLDFLARRTDHAAIGVAYAVLKVAGEHGLSQTELEHLCTIALSHVYNVLDAAD